ncbi:hypothetical protein SAMN02746089_01938 [Caldanaerobius fijiensis DSM 17918]|uniref:Card1 CARF domain-containing protein n=1 Tax=Caldanaerobius fijiensis DSM 17918 TaxID=1121256 RepID=A0A1M5BRS9_9THEO|nr:hypothetical protein [Caldanaerobius fijiensis]SHF44942.1 hypothetical protein SAMN02746089_01938 [Caldanaerobius fijiensis DSM 17918]
MNIKFTDAVFLIGTNPLPNYVTLKYFLNENQNLKRVWFIYSERNEGIKQESTYELAHNIEDVITKEFPARILQFEYVGLTDASRGDDIVNDLETKFLGKINLKENPVFNLNYTGGTKSMAVHMYKFMEEHFRNRCTYSYLDARNDELIFDRMPSECVMSMKEYVDVKIDDLLELHGYKKDDKKDTKSKKNKEDNFFYDSILDKFEEMIEKGTLEEEYINKWIKNFVNKVFLYERNGRMEFISSKKMFMKNFENDELKRNIQDLFLNNTTDNMKIILSMIPEDISIMKSDGTLWLPEESTSNSEYEKRIYPIKEYLRGKWLERYVYRVISDGLKNDDEFSEKFDSEHHEKGKIKIATNLEIKRPGANKDFEVDVVILYGYKLCVISCTTDPTEFICKEKGFEVLHRAKQIGGDEAKAILITCLGKDDKGNLRTDVVKEDLRDISGSMVDSLEVLGVYDLNRNYLWNFIKNHIKKL